MRGALVTGAGVRIGRALAMALAEDGYLRLRPLQSLGRGCAPDRGRHRRGGGKAKAVKADLASAKQAEALVGRCRAGRAACLRGQ